MLDTIGVMSKAYSPAPLNAAMTAPVPAGVFNKKNDKAADSNEFELLVFVKQGSRHDIDRCKEQVDR